MRTMGSRPKVHPRFDQEGFRACFDRIRSHDASGDPQITADAKTIVGELGDLISWMEGEIRRRDVMLAETEKAHQETIEQLQLEIATFDRTGMCAAHIYAEKTSNACDIDKVDRIVRQIITDCRWSDEYLTHLPSLKPPTSND